MENPTGSKGLCRRGKKLIRTAQNTAGDRGSLNEQELLDNKLFGCCGICYFIDIACRCFIFVVNAEDTAAYVKVISKSPIL